MPDERLLFAAIMRGGIVTAAIVNALLALGQYRQYHDARGLRGFVSALAMLFGASALGSSSPAFAEALPQLEPAFRWATVMGVTGFVIGLLFSVYTWLLEAREHRRREADLEAKRRAALARMPDQPYEGRGDH